MKLIELWDLDDRDDIQEVECPECSAWSLKADWREREAYCEECGSHPALECPACGEVIDFVYAPLVQVR